MFRYWFGHSSLQTPRQERRQPADDLNDEDSAAQCVKRGRYANGEKGGFSAPVYRVQHFFCPASDFDLLLHCHRAARDCEHRMAATTAATTATPISLRNREGICARGWIVIYVDASE